MPVVGDAASSAVVGAMWAVEGAIDPSMVDIDESTGSDHHGRRVYSPAEAGQSAVLG
jgi:hypothetical protein